MAEKPTIPCDECGHENNYYVAANPMTPEFGECSNCGAYIRAPTPQERQQMNEFMDEKRGKK